MNLARGIVLVLLALMAGSITARPGADAKIRAGAMRVAPVLAEAGVSSGDPVFVRVFKEEAELEVWMRSPGAGPFTRVKVYPICSYSGTLGPKTREGDGQAPEGFYTVGKSQLNPYSSYHLSFNLGYPNRFEQAQGWTGSYLMVHGSCVSIGCYAMTNDGIEEIYALVQAAIDRGHGPVPVHVFPFRFTPAQDARIATSPHRDFWLQLKAGFDAFERTGVPPRVRVRERRYVVE
jgi:murein L,D-transpeptidase YafK